MCSCCSPALKQSAAGFPRAPARRIAAAIVASVCAHAVVMSTTPSGPAARGAAQSMTQTLRVTLSMAVPGMSEQEHHPRESEYRAAQPRSHALESEPRISQSGLQALEPQPQASPTELQASEPHPHASQPGSHAAQPEPHASQPGSHAPGAAQVPTRSRRREGHRDRESREIVPRSQPADPPLPRNQDSRAEVPSRANAVGAGSPDTTYYSIRQLDIHPVPAEPLRLPHVASTLRGEANVRAVVELHISETGHVDAAKVIEAHSPSHFESELITTFLAARFTPAVRDGRAVRSRVLVRIE